VIVGSSHGKLTKNFISGGCGPRFLLFLTAVVLFAPSVAAQDRSVPRGWRPDNPFAEEEAPPAIFSLDAGDGDVDLYLLGSWAASSQLATGFAIHPPLGSSGRRMTIPYEYPGFESRLFAQTVDLTISLWLYQRYFFEASFADESTVNTIAAGYYAAEDELLRELVLGNVPLAVEPYPYQYSGSPDGRAGNRPVPGAVARLRTATTTHEFLLQLENSEARRIRLAGGALVEEQRIPAHRYVRDRRFVLPDRDVTALEVYVADPEGPVLAGSAVSDGPRRFRRLIEGDGEYVLDPAEGVLRVSAEVAESNRLVAIYYEDSAGQPVGSSGGGDAAIVPLDPVSLAPTSGELLPFSFDRGEIYPGGPTGEDYRLPLAGGRDALILSTSGLWSPFEAANLYQLPPGIASPDESALRLDLVRPGTRTPIDDAGEYILRTVGSTTLVEVVRRDVESGSLSWRYPFAGRSPREANAGIYGPAAQPETAAADVEILLAYEIEQDAVILDGDVVPGTVTVTVDGRPLGGVEFDPSGGVLTLPDSISPTATVDVAYRVYSDGDGPGDLVFISGNRWNPGPRLSLTLATGLRWTLADQTFSTQIDQHPGRLTISSGATWRGENLRLDAATALQVSRSDTTGFMRLAGASEQTTEIAPTATSAFPASLRGVAGDLDADLRAPLAYRDYWSVDALGNVSLQPYQVALAADEPRSGGRVGPYLARSADAAYTGGVAVIDWDEIAPEEWAGVQIHLAGGETDLRDARTVTFRYRVLPPVDDDGSALPAGGTPALDIGIGAYAEDLDGDGLLDEGRSPVDPLIPFETPQEVVRRAGQDAPGLRAPHSEDGNRNGILDGFSQSRVVEWSVTDPFAREGWRTETWTLSTAESARLAESRAVRVVLRNAGAAGSDPVGAGRLIVGSVSVTRAADVVLLSRGGGTAIAAVAEDPRAETAGSLRSRYDVVRDRFAREEELQRVYSLTWLGVDPNNGDGPAMETTIPDFDPEGYGAVAAFLYLDVPDTDASSGEVALSLAPYRNAGASQSLAATIPAAALTGGWHLVEISRDGAGVRVDGQAVAGSSVAAGEDIGILRLATLTVRGVPAGTIFLDELHATDPRSDLAGAVSVAAGWQRVVETGGLSGTSLSVEQTLAASGEGFRSSGDGPSGAPDGGAPGSTSDATAGGAIDRSLRSSTRLRAERDGLLAEVENALDLGGDSPDVAFGHRLGVPVGDDGALRMEEQFFRDFRSSGEVADRSVAISIDRDWGAYRVGTTNRADDREIIQRWEVTGTPPAWRAVQTSLTGDARILSLDRRVVSEDYAASWARSTGRFVPLPEEGLRQERSLSASVTLGIQTFSLTTSGGWTDRSSVSGDHDDRLAISSALPVEVASPGRRPWRITPEYSRSWQLRREGSSGSFSSDGAVWAKSVGAEPVIFTAIPLVELFQPASSLGIDTLAAEELSRSYESEARLHFSRGFTSRRIDLLLPADVEALVARPRSWEAGSRTDQRLWQLSLTAIAINLFGTDGSTPTFSAYRSDEFRNSLLLRLTEPIPVEGDDETAPSPERSAPSWQIVLKQESRLFGFSEQEMAIASSLDVAGPDPAGVTVAGSASYRYRTPGYPRVRLFERLDEKPYYRHEERLSVSATFDAGEFVESEVTAGHRTTLVVRDNGEVSLFGDLGWLADPAGYDEGLFHVIGLRVGIEGRLQY
jgi:hypothetical protein